MVKHVFSMNLDMKLKFVSFWNFDTF